MTIFMFIEKQYFILACEVQKMFWYFLEQKGIEV